MRARVLNRLKIARAARTIEQNPRTVVFITPLLRAREIKMASALRSIGWIVILLYKQTTPITPDDNFDITIQASTDEDLHSAAKRLRPRICHVFSGAVDELLLRFCRDKPGRLVIDLNDVFCPSMFNYLQERFEPTRECLSKADGVCARDLQPKFAERYDGFRLPRHTLLFPEYTWRNGAIDSDTAKNPDEDEVRIVSVGTITLEKRGWYESGLLKLAQMFADQKIHLHIYPHWFYRPASGSVFNFNLNTNFADFIELQQKTPYLHLHKSLSLEELALELPQYDFGIVSGGCPDFGQRLDFLTEKYMKACYSGRISDYLDARLPILINREVAFNDWLLKRYGIGVDLAGVLKPGFRDELLNIKRSTAWKNRIERAAKRLSLPAQAQRLEDFYKRVVGERNFENFDPPRFIQWAQKMPMVGASFARYERTLAQVSSLQSTRILKSRIAAYEAERRTFETRMDQVRAEMRAEIKSEGMAINEIAGLLNWSSILDDHERNNGFTELVRQIQLCNSHPPAGASAISSAWKLLNRKNLDQLLTDGYDNFKRTIALNYFTFPAQAGDPQIATLEATLSPTEVEDCWNRAKSLPDDPKFPLADQLHYRYLVLLLWTYAHRVDTAQFLQQLREPAEGNPIVVPYGGEQASQDLANSLIEYYSMREHVRLERCRTVLEIGGGYGRNAHVISDINPQVQYTFVDIPPALFVAQRYLSSIVPNRAIFRVRDFQSYDEVSEEMSNASMIFLLPHQLAALPAKMFDFTLNISSFGEMTKDQIDYYFGEVDRVTRGHFYMKQWIQSRNPFDGLVLTENDYPVRPNWQKLFSRTCAIQSDFFESLYKVAGDK